eukprot:scaffold43752_cov51-Attheya_sp.AAC.8
MTAVILLFPPNVSVASELTVLSFLAGGRIQQMDIYLQQEVIPSSESNEISSNLYPLVESASKLNKS